MTTLHEEWQFYKSRVYRDGVDATSESHIYAAFFAGTLVALKQAIEETSPLPPEQAQQRIVELIKESKSTCERVIQPVRAARN